MKYIVLLSSLFLVSGFLCAQENYSNIFSDSLFFSAYPPDSGTLNLPIVDISIHEHEEDDDHKKISEDEIQLNNNKTLADQLDKISGIQTISTSSRVGKPILHGMYGNRLAIITNGVRLESQQWGIDHAPEIQGTSFGDIEVLKGSQGVIYGPEAIAGAIVINPYKLPEVMGFESSVWSSAFTNGQGGSFGGELLGKSVLIRPISWRVSGNILRSGDNLSPEGILTNTGSDEKSMSTSLSTKWDNIVFRYDLNTFYSKSGIFSGSHFSNLTDLESILNGSNQLINKETPFSYVINGPYQSVAHSSHIATMDWILGEHQELKLLTGYQKNQRREYEAHDQGHIDLDLKLETLSSNLSYHWFNDSCEIRSGIDHKRQSNIYKERAFIPNMFKTESGAFVHFMKNYKKIHISGGGRVDGINIDAYQNIQGSTEKSNHFFLGSSFQAEASYIINSNTKLSIKGGRAWRAPSLAELYADGVHHGAASIETGNQKLTQETIWETSTALHFNKNHFDIELSGYYNYINNFIYLKPAGTTLTILGAFPTFDYTNTNAHFYGVDFFGKYAFSQRVIFSSNTSLVNAFDLTQNQFLPFIPPFTSKNTLSAKVGDLKNPYEISASTNSQTQQKRYSLENELAAPPQGFTLIDLGVKKEFKQLTLKVEVLNALNKNYRSYLNRLRYFAPNQGRSFEVSLLWKFKTINNSTF